ncbi:MFS transporter, DHA1 family, inner membrane transport protein [Albimonas donghaensis]|uniref:MFS transporter, DHA1 family, inner membrane transport protein n=1 Tax=Albimonas donghaensis TaxID=356660 RepID=A0A1H2VP26_9RHOB|nr:MFS transporter [Albimonas donghaensis]MBR29384.1 MFS transporter [Paracoccaceae bacterium]SDW70046.1 MFS transporter, DHA1 family, inner membrane transport protein [Albimonas donghaensis]
MRSDLAILSLAVGAFGIGVTEFSPMGMLPAIAEGVDASIPRAGQLITGYAAGVMIGAPLMTLSTTRMPRNLLLVGLMGIFTLGNLLSALAPDFATLLGARVLTSLNHGAFFGVGSVVAAGIAAPGRQASAVAAMFTGLSLANVIGVPAAAWAGAEIGWRWVFLAIALIGVAAMVSLALALPRGRVTEVVNMRAELSALRRPAVLAALGVTALQASAMFVVLTYFAPLLIAEAGASPEFVSAMLVVFGVGLTFGNWVGGRAGDRSADRAVAAALVALIAMLLILPLTLGWAPAAAVATFLWGAVTFALVSPLQIRVMGAAQGAPNLAASMNIGAFNLGNAIGAGVGGAVLALGFGYAALPAVGAVLAAAALALLLGSRRWIAAAPVGAPVNVPVNAPAEAPAPRAA